MTTFGTFECRFEPSTSAASNDVRATMLADPGFGQYFTDHMFLAKWTPEDDWAHARVVPAIVRSL